MAKAPQNRLMLDVTKDLRKFDRFANTLIQSKELQRKFLRNPGKVMIELGLHPPTSTSAVAKSNRVLYAALRNKPLIKYVTDYCNKFRQPRGQEKIVRAAFARGELPKNLDLDRPFLTAALEDEVFLRKVFTMSLDDVNRRGILSKTYSPAEIRSFVRKTLQEHKEGKSIKERTKLDEFGPGYGIGYGYGDVLSAEATSISTVAVAVEGIAGVTVLVVAPIGVATAMSLDRHFTGAFLSDREGLRTAATISKLLSFGSDLAAFVDNLENEQYFGKPSRGGA